MVNLTIDTKGMVDAINEFIINLKLTDEEIDRLTESIKAMYSGLGIPATLLGPEPLRGRPPEPELPDEVETVPLRRMVLR